MAKLKIIVSGTKFILNETGKIDALPIKEIQESRSINQERNKTDRLQLGLERWAQSDDFLVSTDV